MTQQEQLEQCFFSGQMSHAEMEMHVRLGDMVRPAARPPADSVPDERLDKIIYDLDAVMQGYDVDLATGVAIDVPPYTQDCLVKMRTILRRLLSAS